MQIWAKRGIQTALVTGGMLMLGTGIASADENVNPDLPPSALDGSITIPVKIDNNALGTPFGQHNLGGVNHDITITPSDLVGATGGAAPALPSTGGMTHGLPTAEGLVPADSVAPKAAAAHDDPLRGNKVVGDVVVPVDISGNAIAVLGDAEVENSSEQHAGDESPISTDGSDSGLAGNVVGLMWAAPVQITGNAVAAGGTADSYNTASQSANTEGDIETDGSHGALSGNVLTGQGATPVQLNGNAVSALGIAASDSATDSEATSGGTIATSGEEGSLSGNGGAAPVALPVQSNGNAVSLGGISDTYNSSDAYAQAGEEVEGIFGSSNYVTTSGEEAVGSGNVVQPALAGPVAANCNSAAGVGITDSVCSSSGDATAGGGTLTEGEEGTLSGSVGHAPVAIPTQGSGNAGAVIGDATTDSINAVSSTAGGDSYSNADDSVLSGAVAVPSVATPIDACGNTGAGGGQAGANCVNDSFTESGGNAGTTGNDSVGGGNTGTVPVALPVETLGNTVGAAGTSETTTTENKVTSSGGDNNTMDDAGTLASNLATVPVAGPVQVTGNGGGAVADTDTTTDTTSDIQAGGYSKAWGQGGSLAGNIAQAPVALPVQGFSEGATVVGHGTQTSTNDVTSTSGGYAETNGQDGAGTGNIVSAPAAGAAQLFGSGAAVGGMNDSAADSTTQSTAGGTADTTGEGGSLAGNVVAAPALPITQGFGDSVSAVGGQDTAATTNMTDAVSGGDITTNGDNGSLSGNLFDAPSAAVAQPHGDAVAGLGSESLAASDSVTNGTAGGTSTTSGEMGSLSGMDGSLPVGANAPIYDVPVEVLAQAMTFATNESNITVGEDTPQIELPQAGGLEAASLPTLPRSGSFARTGAGHPLSGLLDGLLGDLLGGGHLGRADTTDPVADALGNLRTDSLGGLNAPELTGALGGTNPLNAGALSGKNVGLPAAKPAPRFAAPAMPGLDNVKGVFSGNLLQAPKVDRLPVQTPAVSGLQGLPTTGLPTGRSAVPSLDDTKAKLAGVFGHFPIG